MYEGFTDRACRLFLEMRQEFSHDHDHTGSGHLLFGIVRVNDELTALFFGDQTTKSSGARSSLSTEALPLGVSGSLEA
jgi:hypothetical protein